MTLPKIPEKAKTIAVGVGILLLIFATYKACQGRQAQKNYLQAKGRIEILDKQALESAAKLTAADAQFKKDLDESKKKTETEKKAAAAAALERDRMRRERDAAIAASATVTPGERVIRLRGYFKTTDIDEIPTGIRFSLKAAEAVDNLWIDREFTLKAKESLEIDLKKFKDETVPRIEGERDAAIKLKDEALGTVKKVEASRDETQRALRDLERSFRIQKWTATGKGIVIGAVATFVLTKIIK